MPAYNVYINVIGKDEASHALQSVAGSLGRIGEFAVGNLLANGIMRIGDSLRSVAGDALSAVANYERLGMSLESLVARELMNTNAASDMGSALKQAGPQAKELLGWIQRLAIQSPFKQEGVAQAFRTAMAYGFTTKEARRLTQAMIDFAAGSGASEDSMRMIGLALGQIKAKGKLAGQEVLQLVNAGLPVTQILAKAFGKTTAEIEKMREAGLIPANEAIEAITRSLEEDFGGAAKRQATTFAGLISSLEDIKEVGLREFFTSTFQAIQPYLAQFVDTFSSPETMEKIRGLGSSVGDVVKNFIDAIKENWPTIKGAWDELRQAADGVGKAMKEAWDKDIQPALKGLKKWIDDNRETITRIWNNFKESVESSYKAARQAWDEVLRPALEDFAKWLGTDGLQALDVFFKKMREFDDVRDEWSTLMREICGDSKDALGGIAEDAKIELPKLSNLVGYMMDLFKTRMSAGTGTVRGLWKWFTRMLQGDFVGASDGISEANYEMFRGMLAQIGVNAPRVEGGFNKIFEAVRLDAADFGVGFRQQILGTLDSTVAGIFAQLNQWMQAGFRLMEAVIGGIQSQASLLMSAITQPFQSAISTVQFMNWSGLAYTVASSMWNTLNGWGASLLDIVKRPFQDAYNAISGFNWSKLAWDVGNWLYTTLLGWTDVVFHALYDPFGNAIAAIKKLLGIKSPSSLMRQIGEQMRAGLELGLKDVGRVTAPTFATAGTKSISDMAYALAPSATPRAATAYGDTIVNLYVSRVEDDVDVEAMAYRVAQVIARRAR